MKRLTEQVHDILKQHVHPGDVVVDGTAGNGHDTVFLAKLVGPTGTVFAFDTQQQAIDHTTDAISANSLSNVEVLQCCHSRLAEKIGSEHHGRINGFVFNLGYLPGGERELTTQPKTTVAALHAGWQMLKPRGVICVLAYVGHPGGAEEATAVEVAMESLPNCTWLRRDPVNGDSPRLLIVQRDQTS